MAHTERKQTKIKKAKQVLKQYFGYDDFREGQAKLIEAVLEGRDVLGIMPTGAGKSICFQVPALAAEGITLVISPLISLMKDQVSALNQAGVHAAYLNSSLTQGQYVKALRFAKEGRYKIIYVAPERLTTEGFLDFARNSGIRISFIAVDEAHCVSQWGQDFRPGYLKISEFIRKLPHRPVVSAYTATATEEVRGDIIELLELRDPVVTVTGFDRDNLYFAVKKPMDKYKELVSYLREKEKELSGCCGIIYCLTRKSVEDVCYDLRRDGFSVTRYHAGLTDEERRKNQDDFIYDRRHIMVATNAFGMGIDKSDVRFVIHYNMPKNMESYYQEAGRAGRDGAPAECVLYYEPSDVRMNQMLIGNNENNEMLDETAKALITQRDHWRLSQMTFYCFTSECLRRYILRYFGEEASGYCGNCFNCLTQFEEVDISKETAAIIGCIKENWTAYGISTVIDILRGAKSQRILSKNLDKNSQYGALSMQSVTRLRQIIQEMLYQGYLELSGETYPLLKLGAGARKLSDSEATPMILKLPKEQEKRERAGSKGKRKKAGAASALREQDLKLFEELRAVRKDIAAEEKVPPYIIFSDKTLVLMCLVRPKNAADMLKISGVGEYKVQKYAEKFLTAIRQQ